MSVLAGWILKGRSQAVLTISTAGLLGLVIPPIGLFSGAAAALVALRNSVAETLTVLLLCAGVCVLFLWAALGKPQYILELLFGWAFISGGAVVLRQSGNLALALLMPATGALVVVFIMFTVLDDPAAYWRDVLILLGQKFEVSMTAEELTRAAETWSRFATGLFASLFLGVMVACLLLGRWWQSVLYNPGGFGREFRNLRFGRALTVAVAALWALAEWRQSGVLLSIGLVLAALYALQGLAVVHAFAQLRKIHIGWLIGFYSLLVLLPVKWLLSLGGMMDAWVDSRKRWLQS